MPFDSTTRNKLAKFVSEARSLLVGEFAEQLQELYAIRLDGTVLPLEKLAHLTDTERAKASLLREQIEHILSGLAGKAPSKSAEAVDRIIREQAFTLFNRFCALRMAEERDLVQECVGSGFQSKGFRVFETVAGTGIGNIYDRYKTFLFSLFDEISLDLGVLFDRFSHMGLLFPRENSLKSLLGLLHDSELKPLWSEDETIGWIYQYWNTKEERKAMREASQAPRNSRELAVRNQFFTPRYVVEFLTDNTLGRIWYEMRKGDTVLKEDCRYLVRRPNEVFLGAGEKAPMVQENEADLSQEELLKKPVHVECRPKKDPRDLRVLDPACGSGHFLLYAFDLLERIYEEAWEDAESPKSEVTGRTLREEFETFQELRCILPKMIIEQNLHGIDIDPRTVQISALALWLRAQKSWKKLGIKTAERPRVAKSNIVTAEPMPGEEDTRREFTSGIKRRVLGQLVDVVFEKMKLAGEAGSLLKIEEEIKGAVAEARKQWIEGPKPDQQFLFSGMTGSQPKKNETRFDVKEVTNERFWDQAEDRILEALREYAERAVNGRAARRRLFAEDAARGFAFIDLCRKRYDVVLMNPPFGDPTETTKENLVAAYLGYGNDIFTYFVARGASVLVSNGRIGAITNRTGFFTVSQETWRNNVLLGKSRLDTLVDLGYGVLDALVETAAYIVANRDSVNTGAFHRAIAIEDKTSSILEWVHAWSISQTERNSFIQYLNDFRFLPSFRIAFWMPRTLLSVFKHLGRYKDIRGGVQVGLQTSDNFRFIRLAWEIAQHAIGHSRSDTTSRRKQWVYYAKGGEYAPYYADIHLCVNWLNNGLEAKHLTNATGASICYPRNESYYFKPGLTYSERTTSNFSVRVLPGGCCFDTVGPRISSESRYFDLADLSVFQTRAIAYFLEFMVGSADVVYSGTAARHYTPRAVAELPYPRFQKEDENRLALAAKNAWESHCWIHSKDETGRFFSVPCLVEQDMTAIQSYSLEAENRREANLIEMLRSTMESEYTVNKALGLENDALEAIEIDFGPHPCQYGVRDIDDELFRSIFTSNIDQVIDDEAAKTGANRALTKLSFYADRRLEVLCHKFQVSPETISGARRKNNLIEPGRLESETKSLVSYLIGCVFGRWDIRIAVDPSLAPKLPDPFDPLPVCPPGMLVGPDGLPAAPNRIVSEEWLRAKPNANNVPPDGSVKTLIIPDCEYPLPISWDGVLLDDPGFNAGQPHRDDIVCRVQEVFDLFWKERTHNIEQEACDILGVSDLRDYFRRPAGFFQDHLKRYSKSRRQAPIYWPLSTESGSYTLWIYYHRLDDQILFKCVRMVELKIKEVGDDLDRLKKEMGASANRKQRDDLEKLQDLYQELVDFRAELLRVAKFYKPDLNDGVIINAAPLWKLFRLKKWQESCKDCWNKLETGEYDWSHMAMNLHPDQVREKCKIDKSLAIAHGLEELYVEPENANKKIKRKKRKGQSAL